MNLIQSKSKTILLASVGVGLAVGGSAIFIHRSFKSRLRLIADRVELMEDQICDLKDLVSVIIKEEKERPETKTQTSLNNDIKSFSISASKSNNSAVNKNASFVSSGSSLEEEEEVFVEAAENYYEGVTNDYELANDGGYDDDDDVVIKPVSNGIEMVKEDEQVDDDIEELMVKVDKMFEGGDVGRRQAYELLTSCSKQKNNVQHLWRLSKATYYLSKQLPSSSSPPLASSSLPAASSSLSLSSSSPKELIYEAFRLASEAVKADPDCPDAHKWFAITLGSTNDYEGVNVRIQNGFIFKEHIEKAIELKPTDPSNHHLLGRWSYGVYMLSWMERKVASTLFSTPPSSTIQQTLQHFLTAEELNPGVWKENELFISKCYLEMGDYKKAGEWLEKCKQLPCLTNEDHKNQTEIESLLTKYRLHSS